MFVEIWLGFVFKFVFLLSLNFVFKYVLIFGLKCVEIWGFERVYFWFRFEGGVFVVFFELWMLLLFVLLFVCIGLIVEKCLVYFFFMWL